MPRLKQLKMTGLQAFCCPHPIPPDAPYDDMGRSRCPRCGWLVVRVLTGKAFDAAVKAMLEREYRY